jgi:hypothetical protein
MTYLVVTPSLLLLLLDISLFVGVFFTHLSGEEAGERKPRYF